MKNTKIKILVVTIICFTLNVRAQILEDVLRYSQFNSTTGARSQSMGNVTVGIADDFSALFGNPAGLSSQKSSEFSIGFASFGIENDISFLGAKSFNKNKALNLNNLGIVYSVPTLQGGLSIAIGFGRMASFANATKFDGFNSTSSYVQALTDTRNLYSYTDDEYDDFLNNSAPYQIYLADVTGRDTIARTEYLYPLITGNVRQYGTVVESGGLNHWSIGGGIDVAKNFSVGLTINFVTGYYSYEKTYTESDSKNLYNAIPADLRNWSNKTTIEDNISGFNIMLAAMYRYDKLFKIGATIKTPTSFGISETYTDKYESSFDNNDNYIFGGDPIEFEYSLSSPLVFSFGFSVQPTDFLLIAGDAEYTDWTDMGFDSNESYFLQENGYIKNLMRDTWNLRGGAELTLWDIGLKLRGGIEYKPSPWKGDSDKYDKVNYCAGLGIFIQPNININLAYVIGDWKDMRDNYIYNSIASSRIHETVSTSHFNLTLAFKF